MSFEKTPWQYAIRFTNVAAFCVGQKVFLKSNPELPLYVDRKTDTEVIVIWRGEDGHNERAAFAPEMLLHYKYASVRTWLGRHTLHLN